MEDDTNDLLADTEEIKSVVNGDDLNLIEFYYEPEKMECPINCFEELHFNSKSKYQRHWEEHILLTTNYECAVNGCRAEVRRRSDMRAHVRNEHEPDQRQAEFILEKCQKRIKENRGFIDPGFFIFKGRTRPTTVVRTKTTETKEQSEPEPKPEPKPKSKHKPEPEGVIIEIPEHDMQSEPEKKRRKITLAEYLDRSPCGRNVAVQTAPYLEATLYIPPPQEDSEELELHIMWLCNIMDQVGRTRELAKRKLEARKKEGGLLQEERQKRREVEQENRELKRQLQELKWWDSLFEE